MVNSNKGKKISLLAFSLLVVAICSILISPINVVATKKSSKRNLTQIPSEAADFPGKNPNAVQFRVLKAVKNSIGWYEINGEIINLSDKTLWFPKPIVRLFDKDTGPVGTITNGLVVTTQLPPHTSAKFDISVNPDDLLAKPISYKLSFTGTFQ